MLPLRSTFTASRPLHRSIPACLGAFCLLGQAAAPAAPPLAGAPLDTFLTSHCTDCHDAQENKGGLNLESLSRDINDPAIAATWAAVHDRLAKGEMPPKKKDQPDPQETAAFLQYLTTPLVQADQARHAALGRSTLRRLNRYEYENTLRDFLGAPWLQLKNMLPEDGEAHRFNKTGGALDISHIHMARYLQAADFALREVIAKQPEKPESRVVRYYARDQQSMTRKMFFGPFNKASVRSTFPLLATAAQPGVIAKSQPVSVGAADPKTRELEAVGVVSGLYEPITVAFNAFNAPMSGRYKLRLNAQTFWAGPGEGKRFWDADREHTFPGRNDEPLTLYAQKDKSQRKLGSFDLTPELRVRELDVLLIRNETVAPDPARLFRSRPPNFRNPLATPEGSPGVAYRWLEVEGPIFDQWPLAGHKLMFGELPINPRKEAAALGAVSSSNPLADAERLLRGFMTKAYRGSFVPGDLPPCVEVFKSATAAGYSFSDSMVAAYTAVLCSPKFLFLNEPAGPLNNHALATRLAFFLWNSPPDDALLTLAAAGRLTDPSVLRQQTERMLNDPRAERFITAFLDYWLDLRNLSTNSPDASLYPDYYLDDLLTESALQETYLFFTELLKNDLPAGHLVFSDFTFLNEHLANHYDLPGIKGVAMRKVKLPAESPRGGLLTQASVLKVTANGTTTSPVLRGAWIMERILDFHSPPPPPGTPGIEPDTRGATTIRQQLEKHRSNPSCASCHDKIDPPGFALESFDIFGGWRGRYRALDPSVPPARGIGKNGQPYAFHESLPVDASGAVPGMGEFKDVFEFKRLLLKDQRLIARNLTKQLIVFATGAPVSFGDRPELERLLDASSKTRFGVRSIVHAIVQSNLFTRK